MTTSALEALLAAGEWGAADRETRRLLLTEGDQGGFRGLDPDEILRLECGLLLAIDDAWRRASDGRYGFTVQSELLSATRAEGHSRKTTWRLFGKRVGWMGDQGWIGEADVEHRGDAPAGHLPWVPGTMPTVATGPTYEVLFLFYKQFDDCGAGDGG
jgi:hypothetical protein